MICKFFSENWLNQTLNSNSHHPVIYWLSEYIREDSVDDSSIQNWPLQNLLNVEHALSYFSKINDQGTSSIMDHLKKERSFFDALVHLQLARKIKQCPKYESKIEEKINEKPVDILIESNGVRLILEISSVDMYNPLKYSSDVIQIRDKVLEKLKYKTSETSKIKNIPYPLMLVIDTSRSPESELNGLVNAMRGYKKVSRVFIVGDQNIRGTDIDDVDTTFTDISESKNISAVICLKTIKVPNDTRFYGYIFENKNAKYKIPKTELKELGECIFTNDNFMTDLK